MKLEEFVLTYKGRQDDGSEGVVANIPDYYDRYIKPLDKKFGEYSLQGSRLVLCPLHDDTDPSLGLINHRFFKGVKIYHCFGCNSSGTIIRLHQRIEAIYNSRSLTERDACMEVAQLFGIPTEDFEELEDDDYVGLYARTMKRIDRLKKDSYTRRDFSYDIREARTEEDSEILLTKMNSASVKMIATIKQLYD